MKLAEIITEARKVPRVVQHVKDELKDKDDVSVADVAAAVKKYFGAEKFSVEKDEFDRLPAEGKEALFKTIHANLK